MPKTKRIFRVLVSGDGVSLSELYPWHMEGLLFSKIPSVWGPGKQRGTELLEGGKTQKGHVRLVSPGVASSACVWGLGPGAGCFEGPATCTTL